MTLAADVDEAQGGDGGKGAEVAGPRLQAAGEGVALGMIEGAGEGEGEDGEEEGEGGGGCGEGGGAEGGSVELSTGTD